MICITIIPVLKSEIENVLKVKSFTKITFYGE